MPNLQIVENPAKRKRRRSRPRSRARRRRNPSLATYIPNPRKRRRFSRRAFARGGRRRRRNPSLFGGLGKLDFQGAFWTFGGMALPKVVTPFVQKLVPQIPTAGPMGYVVKGATVWLSSMLVKMVTKSPLRANQVMTGGLASIMFDAFNEYVAPKLGMSGMGEYVTTGELEAAGISGFVRSPTEMPTLGSVGRYADVSQDMLAA